MAKRGKSSLFKISNLGTPEDILHFHYWETYFFPMLQPPTKYLRQTLVILWNSPLREKFNFYFQEIFASMDKIFLLRERLGARF